MQTYLLTLLLVNYFTNFANAYCIKHFKHTGK